MAREASGTRASGGPAHLEAVVVHLTGPFRGTRQHLFSDDISLGTGPGVDIRFPVERAPSVAPAHAALRKTGDGSYLLRVKAGETLYVNGEPRTEHPLESGDVIGLGEDGPVLRFLLLRDAPAPHKSLSEVMRDCVDCARHGSASRIGRGWLLIRSLPRDLFAQTSLPVRIALVVFTLLLTGVASVLGMYGFRLERRIEAEAERLREMERAVLEQSERIRDPEARARFEELAAALSARVEALENLNEAGRTVVRAAEPAIVFLQGAYGWEGPDGNPLRVHLGQDGRILRGPGGVPLTGPDAQGPPYMAEFTGSGFLVDTIGLVVTNRHVALPWTVDDAAETLIERGYEPRLRLLVYAPGIADPFEARFVSASTTSDLALLVAPELAELAAPLSLSDVAPGPGDEIVVMGYPAGINALLARSGSLFVDSLMQTRPDFWSVVEELSQADLIRPLASRGIVSQVTPASVVYDAETTRGGSGGPVLSLGGEVIAVTHGVLEGFGGSNLGVPAGEVRDLIAVSRQAADSAAAALGDSSQD